MDIPAPPPPIDPANRPKLDDWIRSRGLSFVAVGSIIGVGPQQIRHYCRTWTDPKRQVPRLDVLERLVAYTQGEVTAADFYPPHLNGQHGNAVLEVAS